MRPTDAIFYIASQTQKGIWWRFPLKAVEAPAALQAILRENPEAETTFEIYSPLIEVLGKDCEVSSARYEDSNPSILSVSLGATQAVGFPLPARGWTIDQFLDLDFTPLEGGHAHWSDPVWALHESFRPYFFGPGAVPLEALERRELVGSRPGLAEAWLLQWIEVDFGQRDEGVSLHATKEEALEVYMEKRISGVYSSGQGYYGPVDSARPQKVMIPWDLFDRIQASEHGYIRIDKPKEQGILLPYNQ